MTNSVITITAQSGINASETGRLVAAGLGFTCFDQEIVSHAAESGTFDPRAVAASERLASFFTRLGEVLEVADSRQLPYASNWATAISHRSALRSSVVKLSEHGNCVIVGHSADAMLAGYCSDLLTVYLRGSLPARTADFATRSGLAFEEARLQIEREDREARSYTRRIHGVDREDASRYSLSLNTDGLDAQAISAVILAFARCRSAESPASAPRRRNLAGASRQPQQTGPVTAGGIAMQPAAIAG